MTKTEALINDTSCQLVNKYDIEPYRARQDAIDLIRIAKEHGMVFAVIPERKRGGPDPMFLPIDLEPLEVE